MTKRVELGMMLLAAMAMSVVAVGCGGDGDDGGGGGSSGSGSERRVGWVDFAEVPTGPTYVNLANATFWREPTGPGAACGMTVDEFAGGSCTITTTQAPGCSPGCTGTDVCVWQQDCSGGVCISASDAPPPLQAGTVTIAGGTGLPTVAATPDAQGIYAFDVPPSDWWSDGDTLTVSAPGGTFPPFSIDLVAPPAPAVTTDLSAWTASTFTSGADIPVAWTAGDGSHEIILAVVTDTDVAMICRSPDDGSFDIPADGIAAMGSSPAWWAVSVDYGLAVFDKRGADGELMVTLGTSGAAAMVTNN